MRHYARIRTSSKNSREVCKSLDVDNVSLRGLSVETGFENGEIISIVKSNSIATLLNTVDDLIRCQIAAESLIKDG